MKKKIQKFFFVTVLEWVGKMATSGGAKKKNKLSRNKERANMSFFIVIMFFAVFGIIVFTEIFLIDERHGAGVVVRHGSFGRHRGVERADYEDVLTVSHCINF